MRFLRTPFQAQGFVEHFTDKCGGVISWINQVAPSIAFSEGWGLYAEILIAEDTDSYQDQLWQRYGALKWRVGLLMMMMMMTMTMMKMMTMMMIIIIIISSISSSSSSSTSSTRSSKSRRRCRSSSSYCKSPQSLYAIKSGSSSKRAAILVLSSTATQKLQGLFVDTPTGKANKGAIPLPLTEFLL